MEMINSYLNQYKVPIVLSFVGLVLIFGGVLSSGIVKSSPKTPTIEQLKGSLVEDKPQIKVDLSGAVVLPGVYTLVQDARIQDLITTAGGFKENANLEYIAKNLNLSQKLVDSQKIYIPFKNEQYSGVVAGISTTTQGGKIGLNSGTQPELESLPGVGPATAAKIINGRPYKQIDELIAKKTVSSSVFQKIKDLVDLH